MPTADDDGTGWVADTGLGPAPDPAQRAGLRPAQQLPPAVTKIRLSSGAARPRSSVDDYDEVYDPNAAADGGGSANTAAIERLKAAEEDFGGDYGEIFDPEGMCKAPPDAPRPDKVTEEGGKALEDDSSESTISTGPATTVAGPVDEKRSWFSWISRTRTTSSGEELGENGTEGNKEAGERTPTVDSENTTIGTTVSHENQPLHDEPKKKKKSWISWGSFKASEESLERGRALSVEEESGAQAAAVRTERLAQSDQILQSHLQEIVKAPQMMREMVVVQEVDETQERGSRIETTSDQSLQSPKPASTGWFGWGGLKSAAAATEETPSTQTPEGSVTTEATAEETTKTETTTTTAGTPTAEVSQEETIIEATTEPEKAKGDNAGNELKKTQSWLEWSGLKKSEEQQRRESAARRAKKAKDDEAALAKAELFCKLQHSNRLLMNHLAETQAQEKLAAEQQAQAERERILEHQEALGSPIAEARQFFRPSYDVLDRLLVGLPQGTIAETWRLVDLPQQASLWCSTSISEHIQVYHSKDDSSLVMAHIGLPGLKSHAAMDLLSDIQGRCHWDPVFTETSCLKVLGKLQRVIYLATSPTGPEGKVFGFCQKCTEIRDVVPDKGVAASIIHIQICEDAKHLHPLASRANRILADTLTSGYMIQDDPDDAESSIMMRLVQVNLREGEFTTQEAAREFSRTMPVWRTAFLNEGMKRQREEERRQGLAMRGGLGALRWRK